MDDKLSQPAKKQLLERAHVMPEGRITTTQRRNNHLIMLHASYTLTRYSPAHIWTSQPEEDAENPTGFQWESKATKNLNTKTGGYTQGSRDSPG